MEIREFTADDNGTVAEVVDLLDAVRKVDSPWEHADTVLSLTGMIRHGWDGEAPRCFVAADNARPVAAARLWLSEWDNTHLAWLWLGVHPDERRQGYGSALFDFALQESRRLGRSSFGADGWDHPRTRAFAARHGLTIRSAAIQRRQYLTEVDRKVVEERYVEAGEAASAYELVRIVGRTPPELLDAVAEMTAAINDAPTDDLEIEDEVFPRERVEDYENATLAKGQRLYRLLARHKETGELAGHTVVAVESERPWIGEQHDTSVVRAHRGHRLGLLLKSDMVRWLAVEEPQLRTIDTWNAESNDHMIAVNEKLGYRVLGRELEFQRDI
ncbi:MAG: GNAT family N-acetyltransferase [Nocardioidaceae bacterium]